MKIIDVHIRWLKKNNLNPFLTDYVTVVSIVIVVAALIRRAICHMP